MTGGNNGGTGFHYFLRDVAAMFVYEWALVPVGRDRAAKAFLNYLIRVGADTRRRVLLSNIDIIGRLLENWKGIVVVEFKYIDGMLKRHPKSSEDKISLAW